MSFINLGSKVIANSFRIFDNKALTTKNSYRKKFTSSTFNRFPIKDQEQWEKLDSLSEKKWLIIWVTKDKFITTQHLKKWRDRLPNAEVNEMNCGHFVQEEKTQAATQAIEHFLENCGS